MKHILLLLATALVMTSSAAMAQDMVTYTSQDSFDDVIFSVESAILDSGLVIDHVSHVGDMLNRTGEDVGSTKPIFDAADVFSFCSANVSRAVMEADPMNILYCPYTIFVAQAAGSDSVTIGFHTYPQGPMQQVQSLLDGIVTSALDLK